MDINYTEKILAVAHKFQKLSLNTKSIGEMLRSEIMILHLIKTCNDRNEEITISTLSERLEISKPAVSQMINVLESKGYVQRIMTKNDRRVVYVRLTEVGENSLQKAVQSCLKTSKHIFDEMGEEDTKTLLLLLEKLYSIVSNYKK